MASARLSLVLDVEEPTPHRPPGIAIRGGNSLTLDVAAQRQRLWTPSFDRCRQPQLGGVRRLNEQPLFMRLRAAERTGE
jgi:hypothetical protein